MDNVAEGHATDLEVQHKSLWFPDGNIILVSSASEECNHFRVHKSVLASQSRVFADMLSFPEPVDSSMETFDGLPVVRFSDKTDNIEILLEVFYNQRWKADTPSQVQEVLLLADKFQADIVRERIDEYLRLNWPRSLDEWDAAEVRRDFLIDRTECGGIDEPLDELIPEPASVIALARMCDLPGLFPAAFYSLSRIFIEDDYDVNHTYQRDLEELAALGVDISGMKHNNDKMDFEKRTARWRLLNLQDMHTYIMGRDRLECDMRNGLHFNNDSARSDFCLLKRGCSIAIDEVGELVTNEALKTRDILAVLRKYSRYNVLPTKSKCCVNCRRELQWLMVTKREEIWDNLGKYFGLNT